MIGLTSFTASIIMAVIVVISRCGLLSVTMYVYNFLIQYIGLCIVIL